MKLNVIHKREVLFIIIIIFMIKIRVFVCVIQLFCLDDLRRAIKFLSHFVVSLQQA